MELTHLDETGAARMVDVGEKAVTRRTACAQSVITMKPETLRMICEDRAPKGDVFACARIAGIMAAKKTSELIPMCHPIPIESVKIDIEAVSDTQVRIISTLRCSHKTGIEMEALTATSIAALTIYDMCKAVDRGMRIDQPLLLHKDGGRSGEYSRTTEDAAGSAKYDPFRARSDQTGKRRARPCIGAAFRGGGRGACAQLPPE